MSGLPPGAFNLPPGVSLRDIPGNGPEDSEQPTEREQPMSREEAKEYADCVVEKLVEWGVITQEAYGKMTEKQRELLAEEVQAKSEE